MSDHVVPSTAVIERFAVPTVLNMTVQLPPTVGYDWTFRIFRSSSAGSGFQDSADAVLHINNKATKINI